MFIVAILAIYFNIRSRLVVIERGLRGENGGKIKATIFGQKWEIYILLVIRARYSGEKYSGR